MSIKLNFTAAAVTIAFITTMADANAVEYGKMNWFGSVYAKFLDGDRKFENALYNNAETTPGEAGGDQGQGIEFELMFQNQVSRQVEIGGRLKARFNQNFWANFGGFGAQEDDERSAQYMKMRGVWARLTPGYDWLDSAHIGSNDFGMFDPFTIGKFRYIDRDNASGLIFQGSALDGQLKWDVARLSLPRLFAGPQFNTGDLFANDSAWGFQAKYAPSADFNLTGIFEIVDDEELVSSDTDLRDGSNTYNRFNEKIFGLKGNYSGLDSIDVAAALYYSDYSINSGVCDGTLNGNCRFSPALSDSSDGTALTVDIDINETGIGDLTFNIQLFQIGADFHSLLATRRESDVLLTEGREGTWQWGRPDYNFGNPANGNSTAGIGYGGWNGSAHQVVSLMADNDFTDFDESVAESVIGWQGLTIVPKWMAGDWDLAMELSYIDYDTNWQACGEASKADCIYPRMEGTHSWGLGGDTRSPYAPYQDKTMQILVLKGSTTLGEMDFGTRFKYIRDEDNRLTNAALLTDAYDGYPDAAELNPDWLALAAGDSAVTSVKDDDREADYYTLEFSFGKQLTKDLYGRIVYAYDYVDLVDGTTNVAPIGMGFESSNNFGYAEYLTGEHKKNKLALQFQYFLSGVEIGADIQWMIGTYEPEFYAGTGQTIQETAGGAAVITPVGNISRDEIDLEQYRLKAYMKVQF